MVLGLIDGMGDDTGYCYTLPEGDSTLNTASKKTTRTREPEQGPWGNLIN
jgi:hypothetical protein